MQDDETSSEPDAEVTRVLYNRAAGGDRDALNDLFDRHRIRLERWISCRLGPRLRSRIDREDIVQETLAKAFDGREDFQPGRTGDFFAWLRAIAENRIRDANDWAHAKKRDAAREQELKDCIRASLTSPSMQAIRIEEHEAMLSSLANLSEDHRDVIRLVRIEGHSYADAAELLGISEKNVSVRLVRALKALRAKA